MSAQHQNWAKKQRKNVRTMAAKMVLLAMSDIVDDNGIYYGRNSYLTENIGCTERTVSNAKKELIEDGFIIQVKTNQFLLNTEMENISSNLENISIEKNSTNIENISKNVEKFSTRSNQIITNNKQITKKENIKEKKPHRLPEDFVPNKNNIQLIEKYNLDRDRLLANFFDYWSNLKTKNALKIDWQATLRNAIEMFKNDRRYQKQTTQPVTQSYSTAVAAPQKNKYSATTLFGDLAEKFGFNDVELPDSWKDNNGNFNEKQLEVA